MWLINPIKRKCLIKRVKWSAMLILVTYLNYLRCRSRLKIQLFKPGPYAFIFVSFIGFLSFDSSIISNTKFSYLHRQSLFLVSEKDHYIVHKRRICQLWTIHKWYWPDIENSWLCHSGTCISHMSYWTTLRCCYGFVHWCPCILARQV